MKLNKNGMNEGKLEKEILFDFKNNKGNSTKIL